MAFEAWDAKGTRGGGASWIHTPTVDTDERFLVSYSLVQRCTKNLSFLHGSPNCGSQDALDPVPRKHYEQFDVTLRRKEVSMLR